MGLVIWDPPSGRRAKATVKHSSSVCHQAGIRLKLLKHVVTCAAVPLLLVRAGTPYHQTRRLALGRTHSESAAFTAGAKAMKRHIFVTGQPGSGKTTLISRAWEKLSHLATFKYARKQTTVRMRVVRPWCVRLRGKGLPIHGFYTEEVRRGGERVGFDVVTLDGRRGVLSRAGSASSSRSQPTVGKYVVDVRAFEALALPTLSIDEAEEQSTSVLVIDEVGKMELFSDAFKRAVLTALDHPHTIVLGSVPMPSYGREIPFVADIKSREDVHVVKVTKSGTGRDDAFQEVMQSLQSILGGGRV